MGWIKKTDIKILIIQLKIGYNSKHQILNERISNGLAKLKLFNILNYQENENQKWAWAIILYLPEWLRLKNTNNNLYWRRCEVRGTNTLPLVGESDNLCSQSKNQFEGSQKFGNQSTSWPSGITLGHVCKGAQAYHKKTFSAMFIKTLFLIATTWKQLRFLSNEYWIKLMWYIYPMEYYSAVKNDIINLQLIG